jgi:glycosyltransferase involved in cell wall biosynthesis
MYDPAVRAVIEADRGGLVLLYEGHYASSSLPRWRAVKRRHELCLYVHNPLSRSYGRRELARLLNAADRVIFCADHLRSDVERRLHARDVSHFQTIHNGIQPEFVLGLRPPPKGEFIVTYFGRIAENKGVHLVLEAAEEAQRGLSRPLRVIIIGSANYNAEDRLSSYETRLRSQAAGLAVPVDFVPFLSRQEMIRHLSTSGAACLPSTWAEGFPLTVLEAMAAGVPVVCSNAPGMVEAGGDAAVIVPQGDASATGRAIATLARDDGAWSARSAAGIHRARGFTWEGSVHKLVDRSSWADW